METRTKSKRGVKFAKIGNTHRKTGFQLHIFLYFMGLAMTNMSPLNRDRPETFPESKLSRDQNIKDKLSSIQM